MQSVDGSEWANTLLLKIEVEYRDTTRAETRIRASVAALNGTIHYTIAAQYIRTKRADCFCTE